jgi:hypothetical protein
MQAIPTRPSVQGSAAALALETTEEQLTDGAGLAPVRALWDRLNMGAHLNDVLGWMRGRYRPALQIEQWLAMLVYGGTHMDHLPLLGARGVQALFGWERVVDPTTFGRFLRKGGERAAQKVDEVLRRVVRSRWEATGGVPSSVMLMFDSTVVLRYGVKQAGRRWATIRASGAGPRTIRNWPSWTRAIAWACAGGRATRTARRGWRSGWRRWWRGCGRRA